MAALLLALLLAVGGGLGLETTDIVTDEQKVSASDGGFAGILADDDRFGNATTWIGDLDGDGVEDLAVGAPGDDTGGSDRGAVWILFMGPDGTVASEQKIAENTGGLGTWLSDNDAFGAAVAGLGDLNADGVEDLVVGAPGDDQKGTEAGATYVLFLNNDGTVTTATKHTSDQTGARAGASLATIGEVDGDAKTIEVAVGLPGMNSNGGAVVVAAINEKADRKTTTLLSPSPSPDAGDRFGESVAGIGDADGDGLDDLGVGVPGDDDGGTDRGAVRLFHLASDLTIKAELGKISDTSGGFGGTLADRDAFGGGLASVDDMDADGVRELAVGAPGTDGAGTDRGAVWMLFMNGDGTVAESQLVSDTAGGFEGTLANGDAFGDGLGAVGDLDGDGEPDVTAGAPLADDGGTDRGAAWTMFLHDVDNVAPTANDDEATTDEDTAVWIHVLANDNDGDGDTLAVDSATAPANGAVTIAANGSIEYVPDPDFYGEDTFGYTITDGDRGTDTATVNVTVNPVDDAPVAHDDTDTTDEDETVWIPVLANDTDADGDTLSIASVTTPAIGTATIAANDTIEYTPDADSNGEDTLDYTVTDGSLTDTATVDITVQPVNDAPVADDDSGTTDEDSSVTIDVLANDTDIDDATLTIASTTSPTNGSVTLNADDTITYDPAPDANGEDSFIYTASDGSLTDQATVTITVTPVNDAPVADDDVATTAEDTNVTIHVLANDTDVDGDTLSVVSTTDPTNGSLTVHADDTITYEPDPDWNGEDSFTYAASDGSLTDTATVAVTVDPVNDPPVANLSWSPSSPTTADTVAFADESRDTDGSIVAWNWTFGDGDNSTDAGPNHTFDAAGTYTVNLRVHDDDGATADASRNITVQAASTGGGGGGDPYDRSRVSDRSIEHTLGSRSSEAEELSGWLPIPSTADHGEIVVKSERIPLERLRFQTSGEGMLTARLSVHGSGAEDLHAPPPDGFRIAGPWVEVELEPRTGTLSTGATDMRWRTTSDLLGEGTDPDQATLLHGTETDWEPLPSRTVEISGSTIRVEGTSPRLSPLALSVDTQPPEIPSVGPDGLIAFETPIVSATFADNRAVDPDSVEIQLDGERVDGRVHATGFTYRPQDALAPGLHEVNVSIQDTGGLETYRVWAFTVTTPEEETPAPNVLGPEAPDPTEPQDPRPTDDQPSEDPGEDRSDAALGFVAVGCLAVAGVLGSRRRPPRE